QLHQVAGACGIGVQLIDDRLDLVLRRVGGQFPADAGDADLRAVPVLAVDVGPAGRVVADQHRAQARRDASLPQRGHAASEIFLYLLRGGLAVEYPCGHLHPSPLLSRVSGGQWKKCRTPVKYSEIPASWAAAMTSLSRMEPPGSATARTPAAASSSRLSANGK